MAIITDSDLASFLNQPSLVGNAQAILSASLASALIADYLQNEGLTTGVVTYTDRILDGPARRSAVFLLPGYPVTDLAKVEVQWPWQPAVWTVIDPLTYRWNATGLVSRNLRADATQPGWHWWPRWIKSIRVTYSAGQASVPLSVKAVTLGVAARALTNPTGLLSETIGDYQIQYGAAHSSWMQLDPAELSILSSYSDWPVG